MMKALATLATLLLGATLGFAQAGQGGMQPRQGGMQSRPEQRGSDHDPWLSHWHFRELSPGGERWNVL